MKRLHFHLTLALFLLCNHSARSEQPATVTNVTVADEKINLAWTGGRAPFTIQQSANFVDWKEALKVKEHTALLPMDSSISYFRVLSSPPEVELGKHYGQLRIDEGEFGKPLARHRLKSIWDFHLPLEGGSSKIPSEFFQQLTVRLVYREGDGLATFVGKFQDFPEAQISADDKEMTVQWRFGEADERRDYELRMRFRYSIRASRSDIHLSDPRYTLTCTYAQPQPEEDFVDGGPVIVETMKDESELYELSDGNVPKWLSRDHRFKVGSVTVATKYALGIPNLEGSQAFIWKTPILDSWEQTTVTGLTTIPLEISDRFTQSYYPGHHNFVEAFWIEPAILPGISEETRKELREANIRFIVAVHPSAFPGEPSALQVVGFDLKFRDL